MSNTPRTDEAENDSAFEDKNHPHTNWVPSVFARELERELNEANQKIAQIHKDLGFELRDPNGTIWEECARLQKELEAVKSE